MTTLSIAVLNEHISAPALAERLGLPLIPDNNSPHEFLIRWLNGVLCVQWQQKPLPISLSIDFLHGALAYRQRRASKQEAIARAIGLKGANKPYVMDVTAGLGRDAFILASLGCRVSLIERDPIVGALLNDGLQRLLTVQSLMMQFIAGDALTLLPNVAQRPDVIYMDPMFPPRPNTALVKKDMQILQQLTHGSLQNDAELFEQALHCATRRVVVKRPDYAPSLTDKKPDFMITTKQHRFEVYLL